MSRTTRTYARRCIDAAMEREGIMPHRPRRIRMHAPALALILTLAVMAAGTVALYVSLILNTF